MTTFRAQRTDGQTTNVKTNYQHNEYRPLSLAEVSSSTSSKSNRLLINMKNKIDILNGSINMCFQLLRGEKIILNGLHKMEFCKKENSDDKIRKTIDKLIEEKSQLQTRVNRMLGFQYYC